MHKLKLVSTFILSAVSVLSTQTLAKSIEDCAKKLDDIDSYSMCLDRVKEATDRELQTWINNQRFELEDIAAKKGRQSPLDMFNRSQRNFIDYRENNCRWQYLASSPSAEAPSIYKTCHIMMSKNRIKELSMIKPADVAKKAQ